MAENKKSFVLYADLIHTFETLDNEEAGMLIKHILKYVNDQEPESDNKVVKVAFEPIKQQLKRDLRKYESIKEFRSKIGSEGGKKSAASKLKQKQANEANASNGQANQAVNDNDNDTVNVNDIYFKDLPNSKNLESIAIALNESKEKLKLKIPDFRPFAKVEYPNFNEFCNHFKNWYRLDIKNNAKPIVKLKSNYGA